MRLIARTPYSLPGSHFRDTSSHEAPTNIIGKADSRTLERYVDSAVIPQYPEAAGVQMHVLSPYISM